ncbi:MAG: response regulator [Desulfobacula sp.]|uniref:response regulator n=1 Tax=Desulfobacula sp. TaxID=2593537 RepID=UPI0025BA2E58|nr:response regulator [Desulfobacula sp.]MCD4719617.1 response regulator [Desulfobacula sp.]
MTKINIMLVDDEERFLSTTKKLLERKGYTVQTASSGIQALEKLKNHHIQVVILDVKMPGMDGIATLKKIKRDFPLIEVIMLTGHGTVESAVEGVKLGAANYLVKPADIDDISQKIQEAFAKRQTIGVQTDKRKQYFKKLRMQLGVGLLAAFMLPYAAFFAYFQIQFSSTLKDTGRLNLEALSNSKKNTIDLFLQERVVNIFSLFHSVDFSLNPSQNKMHHYLQDLRQVNDAFIDVGFLNPKGIQTGYAGPFPYLQGKNYSNEIWFKTLLDQERHYYISDIYLGFRKKPHFTIAVRQIIDGNPYIMRSTLDPDKFYMFLRSISRGKDVESAIINKEGLYQIVDPDRGELLGKSEYIPSQTIESGVKEINNNGDPVLIGYAWLKETPWALIVRQPLNIAHAGMYQSRRVMTIILALVFFCIAAGIWFANGRLLRNVQVAAEKSEELKHQLFHASKLASVGELATGVAHEINNPLAIIVATSGVVRDMLDPEFNVNPSPEEIIKEIDIIDSAAFRARTITRQLLAFGRKNESKLTPCNVNEVLDDVMSGLKEREFKVADIEVLREYDPGLPEIMLDHDQIRQVFLNLINNAGDAISGPGKITITTNRNDRDIQITIKDTGKGMSAEQLSEIFNPFFTTKEVGKGTGLGLSVSLNIIESLGGAIDVQSLEGAGSLFMISLPIRRA